MNVQPKLPLESNLMENRQISFLLFRALRNKFEAERDEGLATLHIYFSNSVGIGEHPQIVEEMAKQVDKVASAEDKLNSLTRSFKDYLN